ncbi:glutaminyl-peptide cyclotransferase [Rhodococcus sp. Q]|uniref:glutaminyl-peptide cyclotransferase n=1 Tax=Rhodococcus sp. Q TaxID=2502252 RepID=UPI0020165C7E|nr:glutaminyl-peptide cyclotransferase [Rhodococcus sp. Q]
MTHSPLVGGATRTATALLVAVVLGGCAAGSTDVEPTAFGSSTTSVERLHVEVQSTRPHDPSAFTQGFEISDGELVEGTGLAGWSYISARNLDTGAERVRVPLPDDMFGEGLTVSGDTVWQLTWKEGVAFARDRTTLTEQSRVTYDGEGWGLCAQPDRLVMSNGSDTLTFRDPVTFDEVGSVHVTLDGRALDQLNELECTDDGSVYANVWQTSKIVRIDPTTGKVTALIDASGLLTPEQAANADVLNGIAAIPGTDRFLITGKFYPLTFDVRFVP